MCGGVFIKKSEIILGVISLIVIISLFLGIPYIIESSSSTYVGTGELQGMTFTYPNVYELKEVTTNDKVKSVTLESKKSNIGVYPFQNTGEAPAEGIETLEQVPKKFKGYIVRGRISNRSGDDLSSINGVASVISYKNITVNGFRGVELVSEETIFNKSDLGFLKAGVVSVERIDYSLLVIIEVNLSINQFVMFSTSLNQSKIPLNESELDPSITNAREDLYKIVNTFNYTNPYKT